CGSFLKQCRRVSKRGKLCATLFWLTRSRPGRISNTFLRPRLRYSAPLMGLACAVLPTIEELEDSFASRSSARLPMEQRTPEQISTGKSTQTEQGKGLPPELTIGPRRPGS